MFADLPILSLLIWLPVLGGLGLLVTGVNRNLMITRWLALAGSIMVFLLSLFLYFGFNVGTADMQFVEKANWISTFNIRYHLGVDGISMPLILLTTFSTVLVVAAAWDLAILHDGDREARHVEFLPHPLDEGVEVLQSGGQCRGHRTRHQKTAKG